MSKISETVQEKVDYLIQSLDFPELYRSYAWKNDLWKTGFPDIFRLEQEVSAAAKMGVLTRTHLVDIAQWGGIPNIGRISCKDPLKISLYLDGKPLSWIISNPENAMRILEPQIRGFGPTYTSKLLRFAIPDVFGAIDTRIVRVFGKGDSHVQQHPILDLTASEIDGRWAILSSQSAWPDEYGTWIQILTHIKEVLNQKEIHCPYPQSFEIAGMRNNGWWTCADVEMALFTYASTNIKEDKYRRANGTR